MPILQTRTLSHCHLNGSEHWVMEWVSANNEINVDVVAHKGIEIASVNQHSGYVGNSEIWVLSDPRNGPNGDNSGGELGFSSVKLRDTQRNYSIDLK